MQEQVIALDTSNVAWSEQAPEQTPQVQEQQQETQGQQQTTTTQETATQEQPAQTEQFDYNKWVNETFGFENVDVAKSEIENLKKLKAEPPKFEPQFANENSKTIYEYLVEGKEDDVAEVLLNKRQIDKLLKSDLNDADAAEQMVKLSLKQKNKELTDSEVEFMFNQQYSAPEKPIKGDLETDEEYEQELSQWQKQVDNRKMQLSIAAKMAKPEIEKVKQELVLPKLNASNISTEELEKQKVLQDQDIQKKIEAYNKSLEEEFNVFNGFEVKYKDEDVEVPIAFTLSDTDKASLKQDLASIDLDKFILNRWFNEDGTPKTRSLMEDMALLKNKDAVLNKMVNETASKVKESIYKRNANITIGASQQTADLNQTAGNMKLNGVPNQNLSEQVSFLWSQK